MKLFVLIAATAALTFAQDAKVTAPKEPLRPTTERLFTTDEVEKLTLYNAQLEVLRSRFKIDEMEKTYKEFQEAVAPISAKQQGVLSIACGSVGVSEDKIKAGGCGVSIGVDATGKPINGADGKPVLSRVWAVAEPTKNALNFPAVEKK